MVLSVIKIFPLPGRLSAVTDVLDSLKGTVTSSGDCLGCSIAVEVGEGGAVCYTTQWCDREALDRHLRSSLYGRVLEAMEFSQTQPEVVFYELTEIGGLELIEKARAAY